jgi:hypothetical protein
MSDTDQAPITAPAKHKSETRDFAEFLVKLAIFVFILRSFIFAPFSIPSESMLPRLFVGDYLIVTKWNYGYSRHSLPWSLPLIPGRIFAKLPARGDVIVFKAPPANDTDLIKRVIVHQRCWRFQGSGSGFRADREPEYALSDTRRCRARGGWDAKVPLYAVPRDIAGNRQCARQKL